MSSTRPGPARGGAGDKRAAILLNSSSFVSGLADCLSRGIPVPQHPDPCLIVAGRGPPARAGPSDLFRPAPTKQIPLVSVGLYWETQGAQKGHLRSKVGENMWPRRF